MTLLELILSEIPEKASARPAKRDGRKTHRTRRLRRHFPQTPFAAAAAFHPLIFKKTDFVRNYGCLFDKVNLV